MMMIIINEKKKRKVDANRENSGKHAAQKVKRFLLIRKTRK